MNRVGKFVVVLGLSAAAAMAASQTEVETSVTRFGAIFVAEFEDVGTLRCADPLSPVCTLPVRVRVSRILKDQDRQGLAPSEVNVDLVQSISEGSDRLPHFWSRRNIKAGQAYVVVAPSQKSLAAMIEAPAEAEAITHESDPVADVELILGFAALPLPLQSQAAAEAVASPKAPHSYFLARYIAELLEADKDMDTVALKEALVRSSAQAFSEDARLTLLAHLSASSAPIDSRSDGLVQVFVTLAARYFLAQSDESPRPGQEWMAPFSRVQVAVLVTYIPQILASERAKTFLRAASRAGLGRQIEQRASQLLGDARTGPERRTQLRQLLDVVVAP
jgi:hypothetical protein